MVIIQLLKSLKEQLDTEGKLKIITEEGNIEIAQCSFQDPATAEEIKKAEKEFKFEFPDDYKQFLLTHNGATIFSMLDEEGNEMGGELWLFSIDEIREALDDYDIKKGEYLPIGSVLDQSLAICSKPLKKNSLNYLGIAETVDEYEPIQLNFELFLTRYITSSGQNFWEWSWIDADKHYKELEES